jgi:FkbM family methyltransferase
MVVAFEPSRTNWSFLQRHVARNGFTDRVRIESFLVGANEQNEVAFFELGEAAGMNTIVPGTLGSEASRTLVPQTTLDAYCARNNLIPGVVKIDVEGAEIEVLKGARRTLIEHNPVVYLSVHPRHIAALGGSTDELLDILRTVGYECRHIDGSPVTVFALREYRLTRPTRMNQI